MKNAQTKQTATKPPAAAPVPAIQPPAADVEDWVSDTPSETLYQLEMWQQEIVESIDMTRREYVSLKRHLAGLRGIAPAPPPAAPAAAEQEHDIVAWFAEIEEADRGSNTPAENFIKHLVMVSHFRPLTPDEAASCLETFREDFNDMGETARTFVARYPEAVKSATAA